MFLTVIQSFFVNALEIILCLYAVIQHIVTKSETLHSLSKYKCSNVIVIITCALLSVLSVVSMLILLLPLAVYKKTIDVCLRFKHKNDYGGLLEGIDAMWAMETKESRHIINCLLFVNFTCPEDQIMKIIREIYAEKIVYQFTSIRRKFLGYFYRLKNQVGVDDLIKDILLSEEDRTNKPKFQKALAKLCNSPMPKDDEASFELLVSTQAVEFLESREYSKRKSYPLLMRIHHSVGDGIALLSFLLKNLADEQVSVENKIAAKITATKTIEQYDGCSPSYEVIQRIFNDVQEYGMRIYNKLKQIVRVNIYHFAPTSCADSNILHGPELSGDKVLAYYIEDRPDYIAKIKTIKTEIPGSTFTDILMTAVSASFHEYFKRNSDGDAPEQIHASFVLRPMEKNLECTVSKRTGEKEIKLGNKFSLGVLGLPIKVSVRNSASELRERLHLVKRESQKLKNSVDVLVYYWQLRFLTNLLPAPVLNLFLDFNQTSTMVMSNLPGIQAVHIRGCRLQDVLFWLPNIRNLGVGLSILTYDDRFQLGLVADKVLIPSGENAQEILDNIIKYIDLLDRELRNTRTPTV